MKRTEPFNQFYWGDIFSKIIFFICITVAVCIKQWFFALFMSSALLLSVLISEMSTRCGLYQLNRSYKKTFSRINASESMPGFPFPAVAVTMKGKITWYNQAMEQMLNGELLFQQNIKELIKNFSIDALTNVEGQNTFSTSIHNASYTVYVQRIHGNETVDDLFLLYFLDTTERDNLQNINTNEKFVFMSVSIDNYEEVMQGISDEIRSRICSSIDHIMSSTISEVGGVIHKTDRDRYVVSLSNASFHTIMAKKFQALDLVREINVGNILAPTLSIGVGIEGKSYVECADFSRAALDMALGRGGDQVVIKNQDTFQYFGGKTREVEKRTKVKARVVGYALRELILQCDNILITGHKNPDADCIGAAMGIVAIARSLGKKAFILQADYDDTASMIAKESAETLEYKNVYVKKSFINEHLRPNTLLFVLDTNSPKYMEHPELLKLNMQTALIDHHRKSADFIQNVVLGYHEPYASSTSEMITEMLPYISNRNPLLKIEAEALFAGIYLDTKSFTFKTGVRTLEAAAYLRRAGIDPIKVKQFFKNDLKSFTMRAELIQKAKLHFGHIAIARTNNDRTPSLIAQAADELLNIAGIDASFVIAVHGEDCIISGRSTGTINVQRVLEKLGGGGHFSVAGAQVHDGDPEEIEETLIQTLEDYLKEV